MKLRTKILLGYGVVLALVILVCGWGIFNLRRLGRASDAILQENYQTIREAQMMFEALKRQDNALMLFLLENREQGRQEFKENEILFQASFNRVKEKTKLRGEKEILQTIEKRYQAYFKASEPLRQSTLPPSPISLDYYYKTLRPTSNLVRSSTIALRDLNQRAMIVASQQAEEISRQAIWSMVIAGGTAAGLGLALSSILSSRMVKPLQEMTRAAERIAQGDYDIDISSTSNDELGGLVRQIVVMSRRLEEFRALNVAKLLTEKQRNEAIIQSISDGLIAIDSSQNIIAMNPIASKIININPKIAIGNDFREVINYPFLCECIQQTMQTGEAPELDERESVFSLERGRQTLHYKFAIAPVKPESGKMLGIVLLLQDVTNFKNLDRLKSEFVETASHELRTPLTGMAMSINLLLETAVEKLSEREAELLQAAGEDVERLRVLVNELLDLSKIESGRIEMEFVTVEVEFLVEKAISIFKVQALEKNIDLLQHYSNKLPKVKVDANKVVWVLTNLITNALRYTEPGGEIRLSARERGNWVELSVADNGEGIPWEYQQKIFEKFVQVKTDRDVGGSGLGLAICKEIIKAHGGTIWVYSVLKEGSTFTFTVPAQV